MLAFVGVAGRLLGLGLVGFAVQIKNWIKKHRKTNTRKETDLEIDARKFANEYAAKLKEKWQNEN